MFHKKNYVTKLLVCISVVLVFSVCRSVEAAKQTSSCCDWPRWLGPEATGISAEKGWLEAWQKNGLEQLWLVKTGIGFSSVVVSDGRAYTTSNIGKKKEDQQDVV